MELGNLVTIKEQGCLTKKGIKEKIKTHENKTYLLPTYHLVAAIIQ
jgi:hypothetical protein